MPRLWLGLALVSGTLLVMLLAHAALSQTQQFCAHRDKMVEHLSLKYGEHRTAVAVVNEGTLAEVFISDGGATWTLLYTMTNGVSCMIASGRDWRGLSAMGGRQS